MTREKEEERVDTWSHYPKIISVCQNLVESHEKLQFVSSVMYFLNMKRFFKQNVPHKFIIRHCKNSKTVSSMIISAFLFLERAGLC